MEHLVAVCRSLDLVGLVGKGSSDMYAVELSFRGRLE